MRRPPESVTFNHVQISRALLEWHQRVTWVVMYIYLHADFQVRTALIDNEFEKLRNLVLILIVNTTTAKEHMPEVEQRIRLIKECRRCILNTLLFKKMPQVILIKLLYHVVL